jgi:retron-type reverse transcriptase
MPTLSAALTRAGVDGQDFADVEAYGVQRWLGELALALRRETYRPDPSRRVLIPKANGKLRPLGITIPLRHKRGSRWADRPRYRP